MFSLNKVSRITINATLSLATIGIAIFSIYKLKKDPEEYCDERGHRFKILNTTVSLMGLLLWPVVWDLTMGYNLLFQSPLAIAGFLWPMIINLIQMISTKARGRSKTVGVYRDASAIISIGFAIGTLLISQVGQNNLSSLEGQKVLPALLYSLLLSIAFVVPIAHIEPNYTSSVTIKSTQRTFLNYSVGFVITGILMYLTSYTQKVQI